LHQDVGRELNGYDSLEVLGYYYQRADAEDPLSRIQYVDIKTYLTDDILVKVDRASMAHSLEVRAPILDHKLMELAASIPSSMKLRRKNGKYIFKKALKQVLPESVLQRRKMGFAVPLAQWFRGYLKEMAYETIFNSKQDSLLDRSAVEKVWGEHQRGFRDRSTELWAILMFRLWLAKFA
jgi:asparagine synthase (glutamine-hydrolysing)